MPLLFFKMGIQKGLPCSRREGTLCYVQILSLRLQVNVCEEFRNTDMRGRRKMRMRTLSLEDATRESS